MTDAAHAAAGAEHHETNYMAKFWWLLGLTAVEVLIAVVVTQPALRGIGLAFFACWKAAIVLNHFMHLKGEGAEDPQVGRMFVLGAFHARGLPGHMR